MRTSLLETEHIEQFLFGNATANDTLIFRANLLIRPDLREKVRFQQQTYAYVREYGRKQLKAELAKIDRRLFQEPAHESFRLRILRIFNKP